MVAIRSFAVCCRCRTQDDNGLDSLFAMMAVGEAPEPDVAVSTKVTVIPLCHGCQHLGAEVHIFVQRSWGHSIYRHSLVFEPSESATVRSSWRQVSGSGTAQRSMEDIFDRSGARHVSAVQYLKTYAWQHAFQGMRRD